MEKYKYIDNSGDKKYFTQIPNMIVNHSTAYEQSLYLIMKRLAGEGGSCYASLNFLAKKMGVDKKTISKTIAMLLKREWVIEAEKTKVRGGSTRTFTIIDLWPRNIKEYESGDVASTSNNKESGSVEDESGRQIPESGRQKDTSKKKNKIYNKKYDFNKLKGERYERPTGEPPKLYPKNLKRLAELKAKIPIKSL